MNDIERFMDKVTKVGEHGCWLWHGSRNRGGYGQFSLDGKMLRAHRVAYEWWVGVIPDGMQVDHTCGEPSCVRPSHLRTCTASENTHAEHSMTTAKINASKTHCPHGHEYTDENTGYVRTNKNKSIVSRRCLTCHRESTRRRRAKEKST